MEDQLSKKINDAALVRDLFQHPGMEVMRRKVEKETGRANSQWLLAETDDEAKRIRDNAKGYEQFFRFAKEVILQGDVARQHLERQASEATPNQPPQ